MFCVKPRFDQKALAAFAAAGAFNIVSPDDRHGFVEAAPG